MIVMLTDGFPQGPAGWSGQATGGDLTHGREAAG